MNWMLYPYESTKNCESCEFPEEGAIIDFVGFEGSEPIAKNNCIYNRDLTTQYHIVTWKYSK